MLGAAQYLYMGKKRIEHEHHYDEMDDDKNEAFQDLLEIADDVRQEIINGAMKHYLQKKDNTKNILNMYLQESKITFRSISLRPSLQLEKILEKYLYLVIAPNHIQIKILNINKSVLHQ